ncbi:MAG TPA: translation initiation factor IF-1 [Candidatus Pacearchaeota archaeon]|nr:translation initiation factor IF-1 [Candidatus Parcubacteria bacterium]HNZ83722.1 translation initiation factor IF-1 [Candidatus Pacearchaeota archaeon]HOU45842.1 translation initiation factor IF-1 [Candidatus Pacearchaeota archaeon]HPM08372.1 translation initiation factor IF-1 [Candidatus Pacearchaeota archaeon]HQI74369.1 translation initiation factor IF-1 [Candidatus Pacearchaeota archaeon]
MENDTKGVIKQSGVIIETLPAANFRIKLDDGNEILGHLSGKLRLNHIKILSGDRVSVEMSPYDKTKGRIVFRLKK